MEKCYVRVWEYIEKCVGFVCVLFKVVKIWKVYV